MQVVRNIYKARCIAYHDDVCNLPITTIYYIESPWNYPVNEYVHSHRHEIEQLLKQDIGGFFPYQFETVSSEDLHHPLVQKVLGDLPAETGQDETCANLCRSLSDDKEKAYKTAFLQRVLSKEPVFEASFAVRIIPAPHDDTYDFYMIDISLCSETILLDILKQYVWDINCLNLSMLSGEERARDYEIHDKVQKTSTRIPYSGEGISFSGRFSDSKIVSSAVTTDEIRHLNIDPELRRLALEIKRKVDAYQRSNGKNSLLEDASGKFIRSFDKLEAKPLSPLEIDERYTIHLTEWDKTVKMHTMPKTVYIFFLRHPQGIYLKDISGHRQELISIYSILTRQGLTNAELEERIDRLLDLTNGNLNQYICRIAEAFNKVLPSETAQHYTITGKRKDIKKAAIDLSLVTLPEKLKF